MSTQTPRPPPAPVAAFLSPVLWVMERPDRFDMYSCGVTLLQLAFTTLRNDNALIAFNRRLEALKWVWGSGGFAVVRLIVGGAGMPWSCWPAPLAYGGWLGTA